MSLLVRNGTLVLDGGFVEADILCEEGKIRSIGRDSREEVTDVVDAEGLLVFPGFIDPHVHSRDPGQTHKEDFYHSTAAAAAGGVCTILEMPNGLPPVTDGQRLRERIGYYEGKAWVDFGLWGMSLGVSNVDDLSGLVDAGAVGVKLFWGYALRKDTLQLVYNFSDASDDEVIMPPTNRDVLRVFQRMSSLKGLLALHCEDRGVLEWAADEEDGELESYESFERSRPESAEAASIALAAEFSRATGCRVHVVHLGGARGAQLVASAQREGIPISAETCPQYLTLSSEDADRIGPIMKVYPPVRDVGHQEALWAAIDSGVVTTIGSDHAPHSSDEKRLGFGQQPAGTVGTETLVPLILNEVIKGRLSYVEAGRLLSTNTAVMYGLYPQKGSLLPGTDADLTLVDMDAQWTINNEDLHSLHPVSPWHGQQVRGRPKVSILRGKVVAADGELLGEPRGRFVARR